MANNRFFLFFIAIWKWLAIVFGYKLPNESTPLKILSPKDVYIENRKKRFLETFQEKEDREDGENKKKTNWNSNIDDVIRDQTALSELLKDPNNQLEKKWRTSILIESTPRGNVIMFYDVYKRGFSYYCDQAVMPYEIMNAVAMKYVITFHCRDFFVDSTILPRTSLPSKEEDKKEQSKSNPVKDDKAFVKFKTYNNATKKAGVTLEEDKTINCFLHLGAIRNWSPIMKKVKHNPINGFQSDMMPGGSSNKKLSYLDYKNKQKS